MEVPACALNRRSSTVLVRIMDICEFCNRRGVRALLELEEPRASYCELCSRVTSFGQTQVTEGRSERKRNQSSWISKKVKVRVYASYILLLMGGLPPAYGAPHITKVNLCHVAYEAQNAYNETMDYSEEFTKTLIWKRKDTSVEEILRRWSEGHSYLKNSASFVEVMLPECKSFGKAADKACLAPVSEIMKTSDVTTLQQQMYQALNFMVASFEAMSQHEKLKTLSTSSLDKNISKTVEDLRSPLWILEGYLVQNNNYDESLKSIKQEELPKFGYFNKDVAIVFNDSMNFLQYFAQVFDEMLKSAKSCIN